ncbi:DgyrCDS10853 [Dimorphilus gyrociliatus]|uniref:Vacuolar ATPase assembly integral membrane protein VMA21 homolog n=1 Tax=Dimorphilus gyrociliatus TaxID=2664684 RepID=A0A7I8W1M0_9ANNE|nr:DgyrCDS10853 [Dimorphilus gyrociliatus]
MQFSTIEKLQEQQTKEVHRVMRKLVKYTIMMFCLPIATYFASKLLLLEGFFHMSSQDSYFYAAILAIVVVHIILVLFVIAAIKDDSGVNKDDKLE